MQQYYVLNGEEQTGPLSAEEIRERVAAGDFTTEQLAWWEGQSEWLPLKQILPDTPPSIPPPLPPTESLQLTPQEGNAAQKPNVFAWYDNSAVIVLSFLFCLPLGFIPLSRSRRYSRDQKFIVSACVIILSLVLLRGIVAVGNLPHTSDPFASPAVAAGDRHAALEAALRKLFGDRLQKCSINEIYSMSGKFNVEVRFKADIAEKRLIEQEMAKAYRIIYHSGVPTHQAWAFACLPVTDKFGKTENDIVYKTSLTDDSAASINWDRMSLVNFPAIWEELYVFPQLAREDRR